MELTSTLHIKIDPKTLAKAKKRADEQMLSASAWVRIIIEEQLANPRPIVLKDAHLSPKKRPA